MPILPLRVVLRSRKEDITWVPRRPQPGDEAHHIGFRHRAASSRRPIDSAPNMKKYGAACARNWWIGIVSDLHQPAVSKIVMPHPLFCEPRRRICGIGDRDKTIVVRAAHVIAPGVGRRHLMKRIIRAGGKLSIVSVNLAN